MGYPGYPAPGLAISPRLFPARSMVRAGRTRDSLVRRVVFAVALFIGLPAYAVFATYLNMRPWARTQPRMLGFTPAVFLVYLLKGVAAVGGALHPRLALNRVGDRVGSG